MIALLVFSPYIVGSDTTSLLLFNAVVVAAGILPGRGFLILKRNERKRRSTGSWQASPDLLSISVEAGLTMERELCGMSAWRLGRHPLQRRSRFASETSTSWAIRAKMR